MLPRRSVWARWAKPACIAIFILLCGMAIASVAGAAGGRAKTGDTTTRPFTPGQSLTLPFPRLAVYFPNPDLQPLADLARYNYLVLTTAETGIVPQLKTLNPNLIALVYGDACEVHYNRNAPVGSNENAVLEQIPLQWLLTQVGARLSQAVSASATSIRVDRVSLDSAGRTIPLFVAGDTVVIDDELAYVEAVDATTDTLTVQRGCVKTAEPHSTGARIAATISLWPGILMTDLSSHCPEATVDPSVGPETWAEYNARCEADLLAQNPLLDGIMVDRTDPSPSLRLGGSLSRTIDVDRANTLATDYSAFDADWNADICNYEAQLRTLVGSDRLILVNCGMPNYDFLNGNNIEGFPGAAWLTPWDQMVFGPRAGGGYLDWLAGAAQPNLTTIMTYDDDASPDASDSGSYDDPATRPGFVPNYRKMRFGLCTALLGDGFFSYEVSTRGGGSLGLLWFDEFDNAGQGQGYLGQPLGPAQRATASLTTPNLAAGGGFDTQADLARWLVYPLQGYAGTLALDTSDKAAGAGSAYVSISAAAGTGWGLPLILKDPVPVTKGTDYTISFWAKADRPREMDAWVRRAIGPWDTWLDFGAVDLTTDWHHFEVSATAAGGDAAASLLFGLGQATGTVWLDDLRLQNGSGDVWRRDFAGGVALVNAAASGATVPLDGVFGKIRGTQVPDVNDGSLVARVTLKPEDGLVLLRPACSAQQTAAQAVTQAVQGWRRCITTCELAREYYRRLARHTTGRWRARAVRARVSWQRALGAAHATRSQVLSCQTMLDNGNVGDGRVAVDAAITDATRASAFVASAWRLGRAVASKARAARLAVAAGCEQLYTAREALEQLQQ